MSQLLKRYKLKDMEKVTLNIQNNFPNKSWKNIRNIYCTMPGWKGYIDNTPVWESFDDPTKSISITIMPSGLVIEGDMGRNEFNIWVNIFYKKVTSIVGCEVKISE
jgi:hypothetical protein